MEKVLESDFYRILPDIQIVHELPLEKYSRMETEESVSFLCTNSLWFSSVSWVVYHSLRPHELQPGFPVHHQLPEPT